MNEQINTLDWAALRAFVRKRNPVEVSAGILNDWFWTAATVYENGKWKRQHRAHLYSYWATPGFKATLKNGDVIEVAASRPQTKREAAAAKRASEKVRRDLHKCVEAIRAKAAAREGTPPSQGTK